MAVLLSVRHRKDALPCVGDGLAVSVKSTGHWIGWIGKAEAGGIFPLDLRWQATARPFGIGARICV